MLKQRSEVLALKNTFKKEMNALKAQFKERAELDLVEKESLKQKLKELKNYLGRVEEYKK